MYICNLQIYWISKVIHISLENQAKAIFLGTFVKIKSKDDFKMRIVDVLAKLSLRSSEALCWDN